MEQYQPASSRSRAAVPGCSVVRRGSGPVVAGLLVTGSFLSQAEDVDAGGRGSVSSLL